ncbi:hypothetical protein K438DRAFT_1975831 [Mycena galopus ATCC 62051]|nr:hypothetical protein K438DRAFT_1975831 [Mycena galopus ATCC 62051]
MAGRRRWLPASTTATGGARFHFSLTEMMVIHRFLTNLKTTFSNSNSIKPTLTLVTTMVWVSNYASVAIVVSVTNTTNGNGGDFTIDPKQNETWTQNHWNRKGAETMKITWAGGKKTSFTVQKEDRVIVWDEAYGLQANVVTTEV